MIEPRYRWSLKPRVVPGVDLVDAAVERGFGRVAIALLAGRGVATADDLARFVEPTVDGLHDPALLPDAGRALDRILAARAAGERVTVFGDFDADGLSALAILVATFRRIGLDVVPYVPSRETEGHGLSAASIESAAAAGVRLIVTVDCGSSSGPEIEVARARGIDVIVTDHHRVPAEPPRPVALVNPHRDDATYPDRRLSGAGIALKVAQLVLGAIGDGPAALELADLAVIGTVSDLAPLVGENRVIARLGLERLRLGARPGIVALLRRAAIDVATVDVETIAFAIAPRINAAGRVADPVDAARLLIAADETEASELAERLEAANLTRRELTKAAVAGARELVDPAAPAVIVRGPWSVGVVGLVAARLAEDHGRPAVVGADLGTTIRASCRSGPGVDLAATLEGCSDLLVRHGGHAGAAGFEIRPEHWVAFRDRFSAAVAAVTPEVAEPSIEADLAIPARLVDYTLARDVARLEPYGPGNPDPLFIVVGLTVGRIRSANGGHTQLVLRRDIDVLDGIAFGRDDLVGSVAEGDRVDVVARIVSRRFGGIESLQLDVRDVAPSGWFEVPRRSPTEAPAPVGAGLAGPAASGVPR